jgi:serine/threonine-protein kinase
VASPECGKCARPLAADDRFCTHCGTPVGEPGTARSIPERLQSALGSGFQVLGELGRGGFAIVYSARDLKNNRYLAIKVMRPDLVAASLIVERFRREAQYAAKLNHPNIVSVTFTGEGENLVYYAMPRVRGTTLKDKLRRDGPTPVSDFINIFRDVAQGLEHAHRQGIVHRDVKPGNIMIDHMGKALLLDFGIAKALSAEGGNLSISGQIIGSLEYMSPEQAAGARDLDGRSDIYSLGIVAYEMLTGKPPFDAPTIQQFVAMHLTEEPPDIRIQRPDLPSQIASAIHRCLRKNRADRWSSAVEAAKMAADRRLVT